MEVIIVCPMIRRFGCFFLRERPLVLGLIFFPGRFSFNSFSTRNHDLVSTERNVKAFKNNLNYKFTCITLLFQLLLKGIVLGMPKLSLVAFTLFAKDTIGSEIHFLFFRWNIVCLNMKDQIIRIFFPNTWFHIVSHTIYLRFRNLISYYVFILLLILWLMSHPCTCLTSLPPNIKVSLSLVPVVTQDETLIIC